jgi:hypothetical protein
MTIAMVHSRKLACDVRHPTRERSSRSISTGECQPGPRDQSAVCTIRIVSALISSGIQQYFPRMYNLSAHATLRALSANPATSIVPPTRCRLPATNTCTSSFLALPVSRTMLTACWILGTTCTRSREKLGTSSDHAADSACWVASAERSLGSMAFEVRSRNGARCGFS